jgi:AraC-like DNA-binding protein
VQLPKGPRLGQSTVEWSPWLPSTICQCECVRCLATGTQTSQQPWPTQERVRTLARACLIVAVPSEANASALAGVRQMRTCFPQVPVIALIDAEGASHALLLQLGALGVSEVVLTRPAMAQQTLRAAVHRCDASSVPSRVWHLAKLQLSEQLMPLMKAAVHCAHEPLPVGRLAHSLGLTERSLRRLCTRERLPSPQWIVGWARLLVAGYHLEEPGRSLASAARTLGYPSATALANHMRRYTGEPPASLRAFGAFQRIVELLERALQGTAQTGAIATSAPFTRIQLVP